ncbi:50S ribosomal protein L20, partial [Escherichia coli]
RQFRQLWIARINAAARQNGISYSKFIACVTFWYSSKDLY